MEKLSQFNRIFFFFSIINFLVRLTFFFNLILSRIVFFSIKFKTSNFTHNYLLFCNHIEFRHNNKTIQLKTENRDFLLVLKQKKKLWTKQKSCQFYEFERGKILFNVGKFSTPSIKKIINMNILPIVGPIRKIYSNSN